MQTELRTVPLTRTTLQVGVEARGACDGQRISMLVDMHFVCVVHSHKSTCADPAPCSACFLWPACWHVCSCVFTAQLLTAHRRPHEQHVHHSSLSRAQLRQRQQAVERRSSSGAAVLHLWSQRLYERHRPDTSRPGTSARPAPVGAHRHCDWQLAAWDGPEQLRCQGPGQK